MIPIRYSASGFYLPCINRRLRSIYRIKCQSTWPSQPWSCSWATIGTRQKCGCARLVLPTQQRWLLFTFKLQHLVEQVRANGGVYVDRRHRGPNASRHRSLLCGLCPCFSCEAGLKRRLGRQAIESRDICSRVSSALSASGSRVRMGALQTPASTVFWCQPPGRIKTLFASHDLGTRSWRSKREDGVLFSRHQSIALISDTRQSKTWGA
ncbi:hypothetical protein QBC37DRAFT_420764 [Rhypophila decipiens]|uniref:Uncharacterized protein n=1 Tax=Rhypophila decipiens TaxID=261697 RepID=A0AAN6Y8L7_9PEZI|nr:hypothetical protein QBC37DRAFT_420764 [Rhypophila decipiens]